MNKYFVALNVIFFGFCLYFYSGPQKTILIPPDFFLDEVPSVALVSAKGTKEELLNLDIAIDYLNQVYASDCFLREVIMGYFTEKNGFNNQEIYNHLRMGTKKIEVVFYTGSFLETHLFQIVGFVRPAISDTVFQNRFYVKTPHQIARNLIHEVAHLWGFNHYEVFASSVPYRMNDIYDQCSIELGLRE